MFISISGEKFGQIFFEFKSSGNSQLISAATDYSKTFWSTLQKGTLSILNVEREKKILNGNCDRGNKQESFVCVQKFMASKIDCKFLWLAKYQDPALGECKDENLSQIFNLQFEIKAGRFNDELKQFGCMEINCQDLNWKAEKLTQTELSAEDLEAFSGGIDKVNFAIMMFNNQVILNICNFNFKLILYFRLWSLRSIRFIHLTIS